MMGSDCEEEEEAKPRKLIQLEDLVEQALQVVQEKRQTKQV